MTPGTILSAVLTQEIQYIIEFYGEHMKRVAIYGGAFDPPHVCHQMVALWILTTNQADQVWILPSYNHAFGKQMTDFKHRMSMCKRAFEIFEGVTVRDIEKQVGTGFMCDVVQHTVDRYPEGYEFKVVIGADNWLARDRWEGWDKLTSLAEIIVLGREGIDLDGTITMGNMSSTEIRNAIKEGKDKTPDKSIPISYALPAPVLNYISEHKLYL